MIGAYYRLIKPRVMYGNLITTVAGFLFAADGIIDIRLLVATTIGTALVISSACVINNYLDQDIDAKMSRTQERPLITGEVSGRGSVIFGTILGIAGIVLLAILTNWMVVGIGLSGWIIYVWFYGALGKRKSVHGTLVGSLSGAAPILAGNAAVSNSFDLNGLLLFAVLFFWQMPEFYSISIFRKEEYAEAGVPVSSVIRGVRKTKIQIFIYTLLTFVSLLLLPLGGLASWTYFTVMLVFGFKWLLIAAEGLVISYDKAWSRQMFRFSLVLLVIFSLVISLNPYMP